MRILPYIDQVSLFDGNSTDGTLEIIKFIRNKYPFGNKIKLVENKDPKNLQDDYVSMFNECMWNLDTDKAIFWHPDMWLVNPESLDKLKDSDCIAAATSMKSFAGEPNGQLYEIKGRGERWKNIYRLRNPNFGAHYFGHYGAANEDVYFSEITGDEHNHYGSDFGFYPYPVSDFGVEVLHFSDVRPYARRLDRMKKCLRNQGHPEQRVEEIAHSHPRVTLKDGHGFKFIPSEYPKQFLDLQREVDALIRNGEIKIKEVANV
jgi:glycosyltransferase involved in cell wall biosynthesis